MIKEFRYGRWGRLIDVAREQQLAKRQWIVWVIIGIGFLKALDIWRWALKY